MNTIKVTMMMLVLMALFVAVGYMVGGEGGMVMAFVLAAVVNFISYWFSDKMVLSMYKAREVKEADHPRLFRVVSRVAAQAMLPTSPKVYIVPTRAPNAFATGRDADHAAIAVSEGLLELLTEDELEGVIGHEISHVTNRDILVGMIAATFASAIGTLAFMARMGAIFGGMSNRDNDRGGVIGMLVAAIVAPLVAMIIQTAISRQREYKADAEGGRITGKYLSLASALDKLHRSPIRMNLDDRPATAHLMIANPLSGRSFTNLFSTHPPVQERIKRLREMAQMPPHG